MEQNPELDPSTNILPMHIWKPCGLLHSVQNNHVTVNDTNDFAESLSKPPACVASNYPF